MAGQPKAGLMLLAALVAMNRAAAATQFAVDPEVGNNAFTAVFDSQIGERITAVSSAVGCTLTVDEAKREGRASCSVPLGSIRVDNDDTKTEHFGQWATNKKTDPKQCTFQVEVPVVTLPSPVEPKTPVAFTTEGRFTICGRPRDDGQAEHIQGTVIYLPAGSPGCSNSRRSWAPKGRSRSICLPPPRTQPARAGSRKPSRRSRAPRSGRSMAVK